MSEISHLKRPCLAAVQAQPNVTERREAALPLFYGRATRLETRRALDPGGPR